MVDAPTIHADEKSLTEQSTNRVSPSSESPVFRDPFPFSVAGMPFGHLFLLTPAQVAEREPVPRPQKRNSRL